VLGPFDYAGRRGDDPNDLIDHEQRRSLRGLWLFAAWLDNTDTRQLNTLDMFRRVKGDRGIIEHYVIDFGDSFGSAGLGEKAQVEGWAFLVDWGLMFRNLVSLGLDQHRYERTKRSAYRSIGLFEGKAFDPHDWKPRLPNPAFDARNRDDMFWAASILARIQPDHIRSAVSAGHYDEEGAASYATDVLLARRKKLLAFAFDGYLELDRPRMTGTQLRLDDLRVLGQLGSGGPVEFEVWWDRTRGDDSELQEGKVDAKSPELVIDLARALTTAQGTPGFAADPFLTVSLHRGGENMDIHLRLNGDRATAIGVDR